MSRSIPQAGYEYAGQSIPDPIGREEEEHEGGQESPEEERGRVAEAAIALLALHADRYDPEPQ